jgi:hypothetical protein
VAKEPGSGTAERRRSTRAAIAGEVLLHLGGRQRIQYGQTAMRMQRQHSATRVFLVLAMVLASLWAGGLASSAVGRSADQLAASHAGAGVEAAAPRDRVPALRPPVQRPIQGGRLVPLLFGMLASAVAVAYGVGAGRLRSGLSRARSLVQLAQGAARAPPFLQPA